VLHEAAAWVAAPAAVALWLGAGSEAARAGAATYGLSLVALFAISAIYHRPTWPPRARDWMGRVDHSAIFFLIAGTYTPVGLLLGPGPGHTMLAVVWGGAVGGVILSLAWPTAPKPVMAAIFVLLGWAFVPVGPTLFFTLGVSKVTLIFAGGLLYTAGAFVYALKRPDPFPRIFGYHEVFHLFVVVAAILHYAAVAMMLPEIA
jgi:hemolysin III